MPNPDEPQSAMRSSDNAETSIGQQFDLVADRRADHLALRDADGDYSYSDLKQLSDNIAAAILAAGCQPGSLIALLFNQSRLAIASLLGVLKAGCTFIPMDPADPEPRLATILADCEPRLILAQRGTMRLARQLASAKQQALDVDGIPAAAGPGRLLPAGSPDDLAYVFYTSGSTGTPKGVCQTQRNLLHFVEQYSKALSIGEQDRLSMVYSLTFSASNMDIFGGLLKGASICFLDLKQPKAIYHLEQWLREQRISVLHTVPSVMRQFLNMGPAAERLSTVRAIDLGGEAVYASDIELLKSTFADDCIMLNHLAATEASVIAQHRIDPGRDYGNTTVPVGKAAEGLEISIQREDGSAVEIEEIGEIILTSPFISVGYLNRPELNASAFAGPRGSATRSYRSGDRGFWNAAGELNYVGRQDTRIKIRGYTVEPGEIEAALLQIPYIKDAAVIAYRQEISDNPMLIAYLLADPGSVGPAQRQQLRRHLRGVLPDYMQPSQFIFKQEFPRTATGKTDRGELTNLRVKVPEYFKDVEQPWGETESRIATMFSEILKRKPIPRHETFFSLGGDSLGITELILQIQRHYAVEIPQQLIIEHASVARLAEYVDSIDPDETAAWKPPSLVTPLKLEAGKPKLFLIHGRAGLAMLSPDFAEVLGESHSVYAVRARGLHAGEQAHLTVEGMAADYLEEIRRIQPEGPYFFAGLCAGGFLASRMAWQLTRAAEQVAPVIMVDPYPRVRKVTPEERKKRLKLFYREYGHTIESRREEIAYRMYRRVTSGRNDLDRGDPAALNRLARVESAMEIALLNYQPSLYTGEVLVLASKIRIRQGLLKSDYLKGSKVVFAEVSQNHKNAIDAKNPLVAAAFRRGLRYAIEKVQGCTGSASSIDPITG